MKIGYLAAILKRYIYFIFFLKYGCDQYLSLSLYLSPSPSPSLSLSLSLSLSPLSLSLSLSLSLPLWYGIKIIKRFRWESGFIMEPPYALTEVRGTLCS